MRHSQLEKISMYKKVANFLSNPLNLVVWASFQRLIQEIANFMALNETLSDYMQQQRSEDGGITTIKHNAFMNMILEIVSKAQLALVWAHDQNNEQLAHVFDVQKSDFTSISEMNALTKVKNIRDNLATHISSMASVHLSTADLTVINQYITNFEASIGSVGTAQAHRSIGKSGIETTIKPIDKSLEIIDNLFINTYRLSNVDLIKEYINNRQIEKMPTHHAGIMVHIGDSSSNADLKDVLIALDKKSSTSSIDGNAEIIKIMPGSYLLTISLNGYITQTIKVVIVKGHITHVDVLLVKRA
jgi:hypothetical protein